MRFAELLKNNTSNDKIPCIAFLGDSVTQGVFEVYEKNGKMEFVIDGICAYPTKVKEMLKKIYEDCGIKQTAKASDLRGYFEVKTIQIYYPDKTKENGLEILEVKK